MKLDFSLIRNFYEHGVFERVARSASAYPSLTDPSAILGVACIALNRLPPKYIRHDADMIFYMTASDRIELEKALDEAVATAFQFAVEREETRRQQASG